MHIKDCTHPVKKFSNLISILCHIQTQTGHNNHMTIFEMVPIFQGLNILLNTCEQSTVPAYTQFTDHVMCAALEKEETVAVVNRRFEFYRYLYS